MVGLIGRKVGMTQLFSEEGGIIPVTIVEAGPCAVVQVKRREKEGYNALQLGFLPRKMERVTKPLRGHFTKAGIGAFSHLREFRVEEVDSYQPGQQVRVDIFQVGQRVTVTGVSKGKGFAGGVRRWSFKGGPGSHGSTRHRAPGSIGSSAFPSRVFKGKRLPGHMGAATVTVENLEIVDRRVDQNLLFLKGAIPGASNGIVIIQPSKKMTAPVIEKK